MSSSPDTRARDDQIERVQLIARLNDELRCSRKRGDRKFIVTTNNVNELLGAGRGILEQLFARTRLYEALAQWRPDRNSIYDKRDYGSFDFEGTRLLFRIDYHARGDFTNWSEDPTNPNLTCRVLTIMLPSDC